jgi:basic membrane protein A
LLGGAALACPTCGDPGPSRPEREATSDAKGGELPTPALVLSTGGLGDQSFNDAAHAGLLAARDRLGLDVKWSEPRESGEFESRLRAFASAGMNPVIGVGFEMRDPLARVAKDFPETRFVIGDVEAEGANVTSLVFREHEVAYLAGALAGLVTRSGAVAFLGGVEIPLIRRWEGGFRQGVEAVRPGTRVESTYVGSFSDPLRGKVAATLLLQKGADVVFQAAGATGTRVPQAAKEAGKWAIGSDADQDDLAPGSVLTSARKRLDVAVERALEDFASGRLEPGTRSLGIREGALSLSDFRHSRGVVTPEIETRLRDLERRVGDGSIAIRDWATDPP